LISNLNKNVISRPDNRFIAQSPFQTQSYVSQQAFTQPGAFAAQAQYAPQQATYVQQQQLIGRGSPYGTQTALSSGSSYNLQEPCNRLGVRPPLQYPLQSASPQQHPLAPSAPAQTTQTQVDSNSGGAFFVTVLDFPDAEASPEALYYQPEDIDTELGNRHPPLVRNYGVTGSAKKVQNSSAPIISFVLGIVY